MPHVSVIIPTYNRARLVRDTLDSVLAQTYRDLEIVVVDDGSSDDTAAVVTAYSAPVRYLRQQNAGQAAARNTGIRAAGGEFIAFLDDDDVWLPQKLEQQLPLISAASAPAWVYCDAEVFDGTTGQPLHRFSQINPAHSGWIGASLILRDFIASPTPVVRRQVFEQVGYFDESPLLKRREDWDMWLRIAAYSPVAYTPAVLARYRFHGQTAARSEDVWTIYRSRTAVIERAVAYAPGVYASMRKPALAMLCLYIGRQFAMAGNARDARAMFAQSIRLQPRSTAAYAQWLLTLPGGAVLQATARMALWLRNKRHATRLTRSGEH
ncbi:MAG: glycosyltransferase [Chloroflexi bacterium]|nr:glycosyltransferase [Chloroflexota bacterium]